MLLLARKTRHVHVTSLTKKHHGTLFGFGWTGAQQQPAFVAKKKMRGRRQNTTTTRSAAHARTAEQVLLENCMQSTRLARRGAAERHRRRSTRAGSNKTIATASTRRVDRRSTTDAKLTS